MNTRATPEPVAPTPDQMVRLADVIAVIDDNQYALERVPVGWNLLVKIRAGINAIPVAPTLSPDIAGLVERLTKWAARENEDLTPYAKETLVQAATALQRVAQERDALILVGKEMLNAQTMSMAEIQAFSDAEALIDQITRGTKP